MGSGRVTDATKVERAGQCCLIVRCSSTVMALPKDPLNPEFYVYGLCCDGIPIYVNAENALANALRRSFAVGRRPAQNAEIPNSPALPVAPGAFSGTSWLFH